MHDVETLFEAMRDAIPAGPVKIREAAEAGTKVVGCYCAYTPFEVIRAAGAIPVSLCSTSEKPIAAGEEHLPRNLCPLIKSSYGFALTDTCPYFHFCDMVVGETTCDGKKKMYELLNRLRPTHVMQLPQTYIGADALKMWQTEIERLARKLETELGATITEEGLRSEIKKRNEERRVMSELYDLSKLTPPPLSGLELHLVNEFFKVSFGDPEAMALTRELVRKLRENHEAGERRVADEKKRVIVTGCPTGKSLEKVFNAIEGNGGVIVAFENCGGIKPNYEPVDETLPPYEALAAKYLGIPCSCMSPNEKRLDLLETLVGDYRADGVVDIVLQACHTYSVESFLVRERLGSLKNEHREGVPCISVETDYYQGDVEQISTRMGAFMEMMA
ncbi:MAG: 2-hydroxyacyl-CoA dehydratase family protein [Synergistaceae bacterium]|jgi:benzoyl-CoA reductase/2-hydroxyglutaryl-CoA dehydratase subunit BcrC/BadD/HgdB|nr:2-hydroxyacyl-CoA dehydratase family protein [Synergistaceae bacterium]